MRPAAQVLSRKATVVCVSTHRSRGDTFAPYCPHDSEQATDWVVPMQVIDCRHVRMISSPPGATEFILSQLLRAI